MSEVHFHNGTMRRQSIWPIACIVVLLACGAGAWLTFLRPHAVFPGAPGSSAIVFSTDRDGGY